MLVIKQLGVNTTVCLAISRQLLHEGECRVDQVNGLLTQIPALRTLREGVQTVYGPGDSFAWQLQVSKPRHQRLKESHFR